MKNALFLVPLGLAASSQFVLSEPHPDHHLHQTSTIYESYDKNPLGPMPGQRSGGYGVKGTYMVQGGSQVDTVSTTRAATAFQIVAGGLPFGSYNSSAGQSVQVDTTGTDGEGTGVGILADGGKAWGDTDFNAFDTLYCSYLVNFTKVSTGPSSRAFVRTATAERGGDQFQVYADGVPVGTTTGGPFIQPGLAYKGTTVDRAVDPTVNVLQKETTYMMLGRFNNVGNILNVTPTGTWNSGDSAITVNSPNNIVVGQYVTGAGIADDSFVTGILSTSNNTIHTVTLSKPTVAPGSATSLSFNNIVNTVVSISAGYAPDANTSVTTTTFSTFSPTTGLAVGMIATGPNIPVNTVVQEVTSPSAGLTTIKLSTRVTATVSEATVIFRPVVPITASAWTSGTFAITVNKDPGIQIGQGVTGAGIQAGTLVQNISETTVTLTKPTIAPGTAGTPIYFYRRTASCSLFALSLAQYNHLIGLSTQSLKENFLDTATMGTASNQVTVRIVGTPTPTGSIEFGYGKYVHLIAGGSSTSPQAYKMDELRFGLTLKSVTQPATLLSVPAEDPAAFEDSVPRFIYPWDNGYGWKSGFVEVEETNSPKGAILISQPATDAELTPGSGDYLYIQPQSADSGDQGTRRTPDPAVVDMSKPYTVSFDFQMKSSVQTFTAFEDRFQFGADGQVSAVGSTNPGSSSGNPGLSVPLVGTNFGPNPTSPNLPSAGGTNLTWMVGAVGNSGGTPSRDLAAIRQRWYFFDYEPNPLVNTETGTLGGNRYNKGNMKLASDDSNPGSTIPSLVAGTSDVTGNGIYSFKIEVNPQTYTYRGSITYRPFNTSPSSEFKQYTRGGLRFRENALADTLFWGISKSAGETRIFALDNIRVSPGVDFFPDWVGTYTSITVAGDKLRGADPDKDGRKNFLEYALDGNPSTGVAGGKEIHSVTTITSSQYHTLTVPVRAGFSFSAAASPNTGDLESNFTNNEGLKYRIEGSYDLVNWNATVVEHTPVIAPATALSASPGYAYKTFRLAQPISTSQPKGFLRVVVDSTK